MEIKLKTGIDLLLFGMKQNNVVDLYGNPDRSYKDEDGNSILVYNIKKMRLTFYKDEDFRLGYVVCSYPDLNLLGSSIIGKNISTAKIELAKVGITKFTQEDFDTFDTFFNEDNWFILQTEFDEVVKFEIGAIINDKDEFDWKFAK